MLLETIIWNGLYSQQLENWVFTEECIKAHYERLRLKRRGVKVASIRYVLSQMLLSH
jgi:hypothetical protein